MQTSQTCISQKWGMLLFLPVGQSVEVSMRNWLRKNWLVASFLISTVLALTLLSTTSSAQDLDCGTDSVECFKAGHRFEEGFGVPQSKGNASYFYQQSCLLGSNLGCLALASLEAEGFEYFARGLRVRQNIWVCRIPRSTAEQSLVFLMANPARVFAFGIHYSAEYEEVSAMDVESWKWNSGNSAMTVFNREDRNGMSHADATLWEEDRGSENFEFKCFVLSVSPPD